MSCTLHLRSNLYNLNQIRYTHTQSQYTQHYAWINKYTKKASHIKQSKYQLLHKSDGSLNPKLILNIIITNLV